MDANTKDVILAGIAMFGTLGGAYITARWHIGRTAAKNKPSDTTTE